MKKIKLASFFLFILALIISNFPALPARAGFELLKAKKAGTIYYVDGHNVRHPFIDLNTYKSWYGDDFSGVMTIPDDFLAQYPLGKNITIRPGTFLVKVPSAPDVYTVASGGVLQKIDNEEIAEKIYGKNWCKRLVDIPEVNFSDYLIGQPIDRDYLIPDGSLYQDSKTKKYYFKNNDILQPFESVQAVLANRFRLSDAVTSSQSYFTRTRVIKSLDKNVFNPLAKPVLDRRDCENKKLKAAVIFLADKDYNNVEISQVEKIKQAVAQQYSWATFGLSEIDLSYPTVIMTDDGYLLKKRNDGINEVKNEVINTFYDNNEDIFDFIIIWTNFKTPSDDTNEIAHFTPVSNKLEGIGVQNFDWSEMYGSTGKLKGIIMMGNIAKYQTDTQAGFNRSLNIVLHEILHNWSAYLTFMDQGKISSALLRDQTNYHWSYYTGLISPVGGSGWQPNGDGTFSAAIAQMADSNLRQFSTLDLYAMGLLPAPFVSPILLVQPKPAGAIGNTIAGTAKYISIDQIIAANGKIYCSKD